MLLLCLNFNLQAQQQAFALPYDLKEPTRSVQLDPRLQEISGLSQMPGNSSLLCGVHDEAGVLYFLRKEDGSVFCEIVFREKGDFEGVELVGKKAYAIKSDGELFEINYKNAKKPKIKSQPTGLTKEQDIEGICYDEKNDQLLFITKQDPKVSSTKRVVYALPDDFDEDDRVKPIFEIDPVALDSVQQSPKKDSDAFSPSGIAIDPDTDLIYIVSSASKQLGVFDRQGKMVIVASLDKQIFTQPEGITFDEDGNLYISNERKNETKPATILFFERQ